MVINGTKTADKTTNTNRNNEFEEHTTALMEQTQKHFAKKLCACLSRILRMLTIAFVIFCTTYVCTLTSERYVNNWVQTVIDRTDLHVGEINFPAVSICPAFGINETRLPAAKLQILGSNYTPVAEQALDQVLIVLGNTKALKEFTNNVTSLNDVAEAGELVVFDEYYDWISTRFNFSWSKLQKVLAYDCKVLFEKCVWRGLQVPCCEIFQITSVLNDYCFTFNSAGNEKSGQTSLRISYGTGPDNGLQVIIKRMKMEKFAVIVHDPSEKPNTQAIFLDSLRTIIAVTPVRFTADIGISTLTPAQRRCYFTNEMRELILNESSCKLKCRLKYILARCNCTLTSILDEDVDNNYTNIKSYKLCTVANLKCLQELRNTGNLTENQRDFEEIFYYNSLNCSCYHNCNYIQYDTTTYIDTAGNDTDAHPYDLQIHYQHPTFFSYRSVLVYNWVDLLVSYGGIVGLFLGISAMSIVKALGRSCGRWMRRISRLFNMIKNCYQRK